MNLLPCAVFPFPENFSLLDFVGFLPETGSGHKVKRVGITIIPKMSNKKAAAMART
jgi:hypothetical protein